MNKFEVSDKLTKIMTGINKALERSEYASDFDMLVQYEEGLLELGDLIHALKESI